MNETTLTTDDIEQGRRLFAQPCTFVLAAAAAKDIPPATLPEVAFIGRSNAGKSSLVNALTNRHDLARTSNTPGRTQEIIFFELGKRLMLADLPGYGHAKAPRHEQDRWNDLVHYYLKTRNVLRCVCLLIDGRHGILANDLAMMQFLDRAAVSYQLVLTKIDQVHITERNTQQNQVTAMLETHPAARPGLFTTSARKTTGIDELRAFLTSFT